MTLCSGCAISGIAASHASWVAGEGGTVIRGWGHRVLRVLGIVLAVLVSGVACERSTAGTGVRRGDPAPEFSVVDLEGQPLRLSELRGKVVILDFWATWCPPCREEIPGFVELQAEYGDQGLVIIGFSVDDGDLGGVRAFMKEFRMNYPVAVADRELQALYGPIRYVPTTFVIDRAGRIVSEHVGSRGKRAYEKEVKALLADAAS